MNNRIICMALALFALSACGPSAKEASAPTEVEITLPGITLDHMEREGTTEKSTSAEEVTQVEINAPVGGSIAQILDFYNTKANALKAADQITVKKHEEREGTVNIPAIVRVFVKNLGGDGDRTFDPNVDKTISETFINGKGTGDSSLSLNDFLPVNGERFVSQLKLAYIKSAACIKQEDGWRLEITLKDETASFSRETREAAIEILPMYRSCMELSIGNRPNADDPILPDGSSVPNINIKMKGMIENGMIVALINETGKITYMAHSYAFHMKVTALRMNITTDQAVRYSYHFA